MSGNDDIARREVHPRRRAMLAGALIAAGIPAAMWLLQGQPSSPQPERSLYGSKTQFQAYVSGLDLASASTAAAVEKLTAEGFRCETFTDGNIACFRQARGTICGERQFVDLLVPGQGGAAHRISTRFALVCL